MLYGRRLDEALEHVDGSRYALVHAVSKRARQITPVSYTHLTLPTN